MTSVSQNLNPIRRGQTHPIRWTLTDVDGAAYSSFTGIAFELEIAIDNDTAAVITIADGNFTKDASNSRVSVELTAAQTAALDVGANPYIYELHMTTDSGTKLYVAATGSLTVVDSMLD